ncbi:MAG: hypothetical protein JNJ82_17750 [Opitutaceae bacterium]|nr:hypothetical protein [Opitutaceae bacterium]
MIFSPFPVADARRPARRLRFLNRLLGLMVISLGLGINSTVLAREADAATVWQWSVPVGEGRAYLWVPETCTRVRAVVLAQHNMIERGILQHATWRRALTELGVAAVFVVPSIDAVFRFDQGAGERFDRILSALADASGYEEIASAPIVPMGHSAHASFPWNFAASNPGRTLAVLSLKGDAPRTDLTGSGRPNPDWGSRTLDGVPGLMVMGEYEWWEARLAPLLAYRRAHPAAPLLLVADAGHGHFDATDSLVDLLVLFLRKTAAARLPAEGTGALRAVDPAHGWLMDRWRGEEAPRAPAAPFADYTGPREEAFWCSDGELARAIESHYFTSRGKQRSQVGWLKGGALLPLTNSHAGVELDFLPEADGVTFKLGAELVVPLPPPPPVATKDNRPEPVSVIPTRAAAGAHAAGPVAIAVVVGPVVPVADGVFRVELDRMVAPSDPRTREAWFVAHHPGDATYKGAVQQARLRLPRWAEGAEQVITFPALRDLSVGAAPVALAATSSAGLPVRFYVREGPAVVRDGRLHLTPLPPRTRLPVTVTVVAWQFGRGTPPKIRAADAVERIFRIVPSP